MATVIIPTPLRKFTNNASKLEIQADTIGEAIQDLSLNFPDLKKHLLDEQGRIRSFLNIFIGDDDIRDLEQEKTPLQKDTVVSIVPAIAGGLPDIEFSKAELARYNRHIIIPEFGLAAQKKLKGAKVLVVGSGGLGSPVLLYLAAAGVGTLGIVDFDVVDDSNLQRQVLFGVESVGQPKVEAAKRRLESLNPHIDIRLYNTQLTSQNALDIIQDYDVVADGTDNFPTRYLVNDACVLLGKTNVYASIFQFEGQVSVFNYRNTAGEVGPNYRDLYPTPPPPGLVPNCAEGGVLGVLPGIIGSLQANEVIKVITGVGEPLSGRFFIFDALTFETRTFKVKRRANNPLNGEHPSITALIDYEQFCGMKAVEKPVKEITARDLYDWQVRGEKFQLIDVRERNEYETVNIGAELIPLAAVAENAGKIARDVKVVVHCKLGGRSAKAIRELEEKFGFDNLYNLKGGIFAYIDEVQPELSNIKRPNAMKLDILAISAHPDDVEVSAGGTLLQHAAQGRSIGLLDLTKAELSTRGNVAQRAKEAGRAAKLLGAAVREQLGLPDGFFAVDQPSLLKLVVQIRRFRPEIILANAFDDRHPDHRRAADLVSQAVFLAGLVKIETFEGEQAQATWRTGAVYHYVQDRTCKPDLVVDISPYIEQKFEAIRAYKSQFYDPDCTDPETPISCPSFFEALRGRNAMLGRQVGVDYAEAFSLARPVCVRDFFALS